jgi:hypothetical protein
VASQVLVITLKHVLPVVVLLSRFTVATLQTSDAVGAVKDGVAVHSIVASAPAVPIVGGVLSTIRVVAGDCAQAGTVLAVPAGVDPQLALVTYRVLIL